MDKLKFYWYKIKSFAGGSWLKILATFVALLVALAIVFAVLAFVWSFMTAITGTASYRNSTGLQALMAPRAVGGSYARKTASFAKRAFEGFASDSVSSYSDVAEPTPGYDNLAGKDAEKFEKSSYSAQYEDSDIKEKCDAFEALKPFDYVVFTSAHRSDKYCSYNFWTDRAHEKTMLSKIKSLNPKELNISISTVERSIDNNDFEVKLLQEQIDELDETIKEAKTAYSDLVTLAKNRSRVTDLTTIIDNKIRLLEKLQSKKRTLLTRLARMQRGGSQTLDDTQKVSFAVYVSKVEIVNWQSLKETWRNYTRTFVYNLNSALKSFTYDLVIFIIKVIGFVVYLLVVLFVLRLAYLLVQRMWKGAKALKPDNKD